MGRTVYSHEQLILLESIRMGKYTILPPMDPMGLKTEFS